MTQTLVKVAADFSQALNAQVSVGATTATLDSADDASGVALANGSYGFTVDGDNQYKEYIVATLTGTALTGIQSISEQGVVSSGFSNYHRKGAPVEITDWISIGRVVDVLNGTTDFDSATHLGYDAAPVGLTGNEFATVAYVLATVAGGTVSFDQQVIPSQTAGENLTAQNLVYFKVSDQRWYNVDADVSATYTGVRLGIALSTQTTGNSLTIAISGPVSNFVGLTAGSTYYASSTAGSITATIPTAPAGNVFVGTALSTTKLLFYPVNSIGPLAGSSGFPSSTNTFITQLATSAAGTDQSQTTQNASITVGEANATTKHNKVAQSFIPAKNSIKSVNLNKQANTGTFTGTVTVSIQSDSGGSPDGVALATKTVTNALYNKYSTGDFLCIFTAETTVTPGNLYWIVIDTSTSDNANCANLGTNSAGGYTSGSVKFNNSTDGWVAVATIDLYFKVNQGVASKDIVGDSSGFVPVAARQTGAKNGTVATATTGTAVAHGLGKLPTTVRGWYAEADSSHVASSSGSYAVAAGTYLCTSFNYNEATSGSANIDTSRLAATGATNAVDITVSVDENVVVFISSAGTPTIGYEIIG